MTSVAENEILFQSTSYGLIGDQEKLNAQASNKNESHMSCKNTF